MQKKLLVIMNPVAGTKKPNKYLVDIINLYCQNDYEVSIQMTQPHLGADKLVEMYGKDKHTIVCIGGDGTFNELISGMINAKINAEVGYIPSGSTNDFAGGLGISLEPMKSAQIVTTGNAKYLDAGLFNGRVFIYTASFGIFTKTSYSTPRDLKNALGYFAYILEGSKEIMNVPKYHIKAVSGEKVVEDDYIFGAICNSKQIGGGILKFSDDIVDMNDGYLEVILIKYPKNPMDIMQIILDAKTGKLDSCHFDFFSASDLTIYTEDEIIWTLDGEYQKGSEKINIRNLKSAIPLILADEGKE